MTKTTLITGGCGFLGGHLVQYLAKAYPDEFFVVLDAFTYAGRLSNVFSSFDTGLVDHKGWTYDYYYSKKLSNVIVVPGKAQDYNVLSTLVSAYGIDQVICLHGETHVDNSLEQALPFVRSNVEGVLQVLNICKDRGLPLFHVSTDEVLCHNREFHYGRPQTFRLSEGAELDPRNPYSATKAAGELLCNAYRSSFDMDICVLRLCNMYGPRQFEEKLIPKAITNLLTGKKVPMYATGANVRDWLYVEDAVKGIDFIINKLGEHYDCIHISAQDERSNKDLLQLILDKLGISWEDGIESVADRPGHDPGYALSSSLLRSKGWAPSYTISEGLDLTIKYYKDQMSGTGKN